MSLSKTGIEYATHAWNPLVGCGNTACPVRKDCWARAMIRYRNNGCQQCREFTPHLHPERLAIPKSRKPRVIVANFLGDWMTHTADDICAAVETMCDHPDDTFLTLTKRPDLLPIHFHNCDYMGNVWFGASVTDQRSMLLAGTWLLSRCFHGWKRWLSVEPLLEPVDIACSGDTDDLPDWIVVGALTRNGRTVPPEKGGTRLEWVLRITTWCYENKVPCFVKQNVLGEDTSGWPRELPWAAAKEAK